jgi:hypothetical protein
VNEITILPQLGINAVYIISDVGTPLVIRNYSDRAVFTKDSVTVSGFLTAINMFTESALGIYLSDIGIFDQRLFFKYQSETYYIIVIDEASFKSLSLQDSRQFIEELLWILINGFNEFYSDATERYKLLELKEHLDNFSNEVDRLIIEGAKSWLQTLASMRKVNSTILAQMGEIKVSSTILTSSGLLDVYIIEDEELVFELNIDDKNVDRSNTIINLNKTISSFGENALVTSVSDIGFFTTRIYLKKSDKSRVIMLMANELIYLQFPIYIIKLIFEDFMVKLDRSISKKIEIGPHFKIEMSRLLYQSIEEIEFILSIAPF